MSYSEDNNSEIMLVTLMLLSEQKLRKANR